MKDKKLITVATPTYNRAYTLSACYESLCDQTDMRFVWMVIDDGSEDNTEATVSEWIKENKISIIYLKKDNGGKASALNVGIDNLITPFAVCLDSDDTFYPNAVEKAISELMSIADDKRYCGILALRNSPDGQVMGGRNIPKYMTQVTGADVMLKLRLKSEYICFYKTQLLKKFRFPEFDGEKFVSPAWMMYTITQNHYYKVSWKKYCCCEYIEDGLTRNKKEVIKKNPKGYTCVKKLSLEFSDSLFSIVKNGIMYNYGCILSKDKYWLKHSPKKAWTFILRPLGWCIYFINK